MDAGPEKAANRNQPRRPLKLHTGALAMLDILGFKGIWRRHNAAEVIDRLLVLGEQVPKALDFAFPGFAGISLRRAYRYWGELQAHFSLISDTVVIGLSHDEDEDRCASQVALQAMGKVVALVCEVAIIGSPILALRGAIAFGQFAIHDRFIIGEAVDDAATHMNLADGALVWTTPSAIRVLDGIPRDRLSHFFVEHELPLKDGRTVRTLVARHYESNLVEPQRSYIRSRLLSTFIGPLESRSA